MDFAALLIALGLLAGTPSSDGGTVHTDGGGAPISNPVSSASPSGS